MQLYELGKLIGIGSFGQVFLCKHKYEQKFYVVKKLRMLELEQKQRENIQNELKLLQKFRHPDIVSYKDSFTDKDGNLCIVMLYCEAGDMYSKIRSTKEKGENFKEGQILDWIAQTALAIHYLHNQKILHRDLKSQNLFLKADQRIRLGDFGISKVLDSAQDLTATCIGTPYYMSPQMFKYKSYSYKCDIWSFGVIIYEMCNLRLPFEAQSYNALAIKIIKGSYPSITPTYSKQLRDLVTSMLSVKPQNRPTIVDIINKPFIRTRVQKYIGDLINRTGTYVQQSDQLYLDSLRDQAIQLGITINSETELLTKHPSAKDLQKKFTRGIVSRKGENQQENKQFYEKRRSLLERDSVSLEKNIKRRQETNTSSYSSFSYKALNLGYDLKDEKLAFVDHNKKKMMQKQSKTIPEPNQKRYPQEKTIKTQHSQQKQQQFDNIRRFRMQEDYSMQDQPSDIESQIDEQIIREQSEEDLQQFASTRLNYENQLQEEAPQNYNKSYYKILDQTKVLQHLCESGIGTNRYIRAHHAVTNGCTKNQLMEILGHQFIGYWHLLDQIIFNDRILQTLSKS